MPRRLLVMKFSKNALSVVAQLLNVHYSPTPHVKYENRGAMDQY